MTLIWLQIYIIGGDGTHKGAQAIHEVCTDSICSTSILFGRVNSLQHMILLFRPCRKASTLIWRFDIKGATQWPLLCQKIWYVLEMLSVALMVPLLISVSPAGMQEEGFKGCGCRHSENNRQRHRCKILKSLSVITLHLCEPTLRISNLGLCYVRVIGMFDMCLADYRQILWFWYSSWRSPARNKCCPCGSRECS
jgi:hypothetical protein